ncbi:MAG: VOC family protein [Gammaproteobacteria bacterium]
MAHRVVWFDIPVVSLERAMSFYENVLAVELLADVSAGIAVFSHSRSD